MPFLPNHSSPQYATQINRGRPKFDPVGTVLFSHPETHPSTRGLPIQQFTQVRFHFAGPVMKYIHGGRSVVPIHPRIAERVEFSWVAHVRRFWEYGQSPELPLPSLDLMDGVVIDLSYVDMWVRTNAVADKVMFLMFVGSLTPDKVKRDQHDLLKWDIVCPECEEAITHHVFDEHWNGRYLEHRGTSQCKRKNPLPW